MDGSGWPPGGAAGTPAASATAPSSVMQVLGYALGRFLAWQERGRSRHKLLMLDDRMLRDIGLDRATAEHEATKRFWTP